MQFKLLGKLNFEDIHSFNFDGKQYRTNHKPTGLILKLVSDLEY